MARVQVLDSRELCFRDVGVVSAKKISVVVNDIGTVVEAPQFQLFLAISGPPIAKELFLHLPRRSRCDWNVVLATAESHDAKASPNAEAS